MAQEHSHSEVVIREWQEFNRSLLFWRSFAKSFIFLNFSMIVTKAFRKAYAPSSFEPARLLRPNPMWMTEKMRWRCRDKYNSYCSVALADKPPQKINFHEQYLFYRREQTMGQPQAMPSVCPIRQQRKSMGIVRNGSSGSYWRMICNGLHKRTKVKSKIFTELSGTAINARFENCNWVTRFVAILGRIGCAGGRESILCNG